jgi:cathepsin L
MGIISKTIHSLYLMIVLMMILTSSSIVLGNEEKSFIAHLRMNSLIYTGDEYYFRLGIYVTNSQYVKKFNHQQSSFQLGMTSLSTLTYAEYKALLGFKGTKHGDLKESRVLIPKKRVKSGHPDSFDWRTEGKVQVVKDQKQCGSCWAFAAIGAPESMYAVYSNQLFDLSEQNLINCDTYDGGCNGGHFINAWVYVLKNQEGNFTTTELSPYFGNPGDTYKCSFGSVSWRTTFFQVIGYLNNPSEHDLAEVLYEYNPFACAIEASHASFQLYMSGVYYESSCSSTNLNHAILTVGYGSAGTGLDYWIVKNSWGTGWGESGYIRMSRNKNNNCGIVTDIGTPMIYY